MRLAALLASVLLLAGCATDPVSTVWRRGEAVVQLLAEQTRGVEPGTAMSLADLVPFRWERLYLVPAAGPSAAVRDSLGPGWATLAAGAPTDRPGAPLLLFLAGGEVVAAGALPPAAAGLDPALLGRGYAPDEARFRMRRDSGAPPRLEP